MPTATHDPPAPRSDAESAPTMVVIDDALTDFGALAQAHERPSGFLRAALCRLAADRGQSAVGVQGRCGAESVSFYQQLDESSGNSALKESMRQQLIACQSEAGLLLSGPHFIEGRRLYLVALKIESEQHHLSACCCFATKPSTRQELDLSAARLRGDVWRIIQAMPSAETGSDSSGEPDVSSRTMAVDSAARFAQFESTTAFAYALVNSLAQRTGCEQVALGIVRGANVKLAAVSGQERFKPSSPGIVDIQQAMEEALDAGATVCAQRQQAPSSAQTLPIHRRWSNTTHSATCSMILKVGDQAVAVVSLRRSNDLGFTDEMLAALDESVSPFAASIKMSLRAERSLVAHVSDSLTGKVRDVATAKTRTGALLRLGVLAAVAMFLLGWLPYRPLTPAAVVAGGLQRTIAAFDMRLGEVFVRSGDKVEAGQLLAQFDTELLELERDRLQSRRDQAEVDVRAALVAGDAGAASLAKSAASVFQAQLDAVNQKINLCSLRAPTDGVIIEEDLHDKAGQVFPQGQLLISFAPQEFAELEIRLPEHQARYLEPGQRGVFVSAADPAIRASYLVENVSGAAQVIDGTNVIVARAKLLSQSAQFRQGVEGYAKTSVGWKPLPWIALHRVYEYARTNFWL